MPNPKLAAKAAAEAKYKAKYEEKLKQAKAEFEELLKQAHEVYEKRLDMALQHSADAALMAADDVFDVNEYSAEKFHVAHVEYVNQMARLLIEDSKSDPEISYTKTDVDRRLLQIVGKDNFVPFEERYGGKKDA